jgi:beta-galactosidase
MFGWNFILQITNTQFVETIQGLEFSWPANGDRCELGTGVLSLPIH